MADDIASSEPSAALPNATEHRREPMLGANQYRRRYTNRGQMRSRTVSDATSVLGLPDWALTEEVLNSIAALMQELDGLRADLEQSEARQLYIESLADQHSFLPVKNRRAFLRELSNALLFVEAGGSETCLVWIDVRSAFDVKCAHGHRAMAALLHVVADVLAKTIRTTDTVGSLSGMDFGLILHQADAEAAAQKIKTVVSTLAAKPFAWGEARIPILVEWRVHQLRSGESADDALDMADPALNRNDAAGSVS